MDCDNLLKVKESAKDVLSEQLRNSLSGDVFGSKFCGYICTRRSNLMKVDSHRKGPIPIEECILTKSTQTATYGTLDSECEELDFEDLRERNLNSTDFNKIRITKNDRGDSIASCRALIMYFSKLAKAKDEEELIDLNFVEKLFDSGADINFPDKHGQTIMHEISRGWHPDVAKFALEHGAEINKADAFGRTPLHLAAAVDYGEMVEYLVDNGADLSRETYGEGQTAMHYAAKNNATHSLKVMLRLGARINDRDEKRRTPLFIAAEAARAESACFLIEQGAPCGVYDSSGTSLLSLLIEKMPSVAMDAIGQFHLLDRAFRKHYYYLSHLEPDAKFLLEKIPNNKQERKDLEGRKKAEKKLLKADGIKEKKKAKSYAKTPLEVIVQCNQLDLVMHPVFQRLLYVKWHLFGKAGSIKMLLLNLFYTLVWTVLGILIPRGSHHFYIPLKENWWRVILEAIGVILTIYFLVSEINLLKSGERAHHRWRRWRSQHVEKDLKYCHPRWPEEEKYIRSELNQIRSYQRTYFREPWNIFEWVTYLVILVLIITRISSVASGDKIAEDLHPRFYAIGLIIIWLRFMRACRSFRLIGPFIAILGSVIADTLKFAFLFFEFFIPYTVAFWILFGGDVNAHKMVGHAVNWQHFPDLMFSVWYMTLMGSFDWKGLVIIDRVMAQILCGTYFALSGVICMNLYIALLSDTFSRVYLQAQANAVMQQAKTIILLETKLSKYYRSKYGHHMQQNCSPQEVYAHEDSNHIEGNEHDKLEKVTRHITNRIDELDDSLKRKEVNNNFHVPPSCRRDSIWKESGCEKDVLLRFIEDQTFHNHKEKMEIEGLKIILNKIRLLLFHQKLLPLCDKTLPLQYKTLPLQDKTLPLQDKTLPLQDKTLPLQDKALPFQDITLPLQGMAPQMKPCLTNDYDARRSATLPRVERNVNKNIPAPACSSSSLENLLTTQQESTQNSPFKQQNSPYTEGNPILGAPFTQQDLLSVPFTQGNPLSAPFTQGNPALRAPLTRGNSVLHAPLTRGNSVLSAPSTQGDSYSPSIYVEIPQMEILHEYPEVLSGRTSGASTPTSKGGKRRRRRKKVNSSFVEAPSNHNTSNIERSEQSV